MSELCAATIKRISSFSTLWRAIVKSECCNLCASAYLFDNHPRRLRLLRTSLNVALIGGIRGQLPAYREMNLFMLFVTTQKVTSSLNVTDTMSRRKGATTRTHKSWRLCSVQAHRNKLVLHHSAMAPKRKRSREEKSPSTKPTEETILSQEEKLSGLFQKLEEMSARHGGYPCFKNTDDPAIAARTLNQIGFFFMPRCVEEWFVEEWVEKQIRSTVDLFPDAFKGAQKEKIIARHDLHAFQSLKTAKHGFASIRFGAMFQQPAALEEQPVFRVGGNGAGGEDVYMARLPWYVNNVKMMCEEPMRANTMFLLKVVRGDRKEVPMCGPDSVKLIQENKPLLTPPHTDNYEDRVQVCLNNDEEIKMGFIPNSHLPEFKSVLDEIILILKGKSLNKRPRAQKPPKDGYQGLPDNPYLIDRLRKMAIAPPKCSIAAWTSGVIHMEMPAKESQPACHISDDTLSLLDQRRVRFYIGLNFLDNKDNVMSREDRIRLGLVAHRHDLVPQMFFNDNKHNKKIWPYIVAKRNSQWKKRRTTYDGECAELQDLCNEDTYTEENLIKEIPDDLKRTLLTGIDFKM